MNPREEAAPIVCRRVMESLTSCLNAIERAFGDRKRGMAAVLSGGAESDFDPAINVKARTLARSLQYHYVLKDNHNLTNTTRKSPL